jgi:hypothetical protein
MDDHARCKSRQDLEQLEAHIASSLQDVRRVDKLDVAGGEVLKDLNGHLLNGLL